MGAVVTRTTLTCRAGLSATAGGGKPAANYSYVAPCCALADECDHVCLAGMVPWA